MVAARVGQWETGTKPVQTKLTIPFIIHHKLDRFPESPFPGLIESSLQAIQIYQRLQLDDESRNLARLFHMVCTEKSL